jgi:hypothetical protein
MTQDEALRLFEYRDGRLHHRTASRGRNIGDPIGSVNGTGYRRVGMGGKYYTEHALVYLTVFVTTIALRISVQLRAARTNTTRGNAATIRPVIAACRGIRQRENGVCESV